MTLQAERTTKPVRRREGSTRMAIYDYIVSFSNQYGFPPTIREIGEAMGLSSSGTVSAHLRRLEQDHMIERYANHARAIRPRCDVRRGGCFFTRRQDDKRRRRACGCRAVCTTGFFICC